MRILNPENQVHITLFQRIANLTGAKEYKLPFGLDFLMKQEVTDEFESSPPCLLELLRLLHQILGIVL